MSKPVIAITRPRNRANQASKIVEKLGGQAILTPTLELRPINTDSLKYLVSHLNDLDWIVFTSPTTIQSLNKFYPSFLNSIDCNVAVIGRKTKEVANSFNVDVDLVPKDYTAEGLLDSFSKIDIKNKTIGIPRTASARDTLPIGLEKFGANVILAEAYKSLIPEDEKIINNLIEKIRHREIDAITFTSPLTVENLFIVDNNRHKDEIANILSNDILTVSIGPITSKVLDKYNIKNIYPKEYTVKEMLELLFKNL